MYYEDSMRSESACYKNLHSLQSVPPNSLEAYVLAHSRSFPLTLVASLIELGTLQPFEPSSERVEFFESTTGMPYAPPTSVDRSDGITIRCPCCVVPTQYRVPWWDSEG